MYPNLCLVRDFFPQIALAHPCPRPGTPEPLGDPKWSQRASRSTPGQQPSMPGSGVVPLGATQLAFKVPSNPSLSVLTPSNGLFGSSLIIQNVKDVSGSGNIS